jgi:hypothetical protein
MDLDGLAQKTSTRDASEINTSRQSLSSVHFHLSPLSTMKHVMLTFEQVNFCHVMSMIKLYKNSSKNITLEN